MDPSEPGSDQTDLDAEDARSHREDQHLRQGVATQQSQLAKQLAKQLAMQLARQLAKQLARPRASTIARAAGKAKGKHKRKGSCNGNEDGICVWNFLEM